MMHRSPPAHAHHRPPLAPSLALVAALSLAASTLSPCSARAQQTLTRPAPLVPLPGPPRPPRIPMRPATSAAAAPLPAALATPRGAPELEPLKFLLGKWRCDGKQFASAVFGPEHAFKATAENRLTVDGAFHQFLYEEKASKEHVGVKVQALWGWEAASRHLVRAAASSDGTWDSATSPGLEGDKVVWTGVFATAAGRAPFRHTFTRKSDLEWSHTLELKDASGRWTATSEVDCKR